MNPDKADEPRCWWIRAGKEMNVENRMKKKKPSTTQSHPRETSALLLPCFLSTLHHSDFFPVILSLRHSLPHLLCVCPEVIVHCTGLSLLLSCSLSLSVDGCINAPSPSSLREDSGFCCNCFSARDNVCNSLSAARCHSGGLFLYSQADRINMCVWN